MYLLLYMVFMSAWINVINRNSSHALELQLEGGRSCNIIYNTPLSSTLFNQDKYSYWVAHLECWLWTTYHRQNEGMIYSELCLFLVSRMDYHTLSPYEWRGDTPLDQSELLSCTDVVPMATKIGAWKLLKIPAASGPGTPFAQVAKLHATEPMP